MEETVEKEVRSFRKALDIWVASRSPCTECCRQVCASHLSNDSHRQGSRGEKIAPRLADPGAFIYTNLGPFGFAKLWDS